jgi:AraC family transcriptional regulator of adaptative response/methylated-DNA-[protein]-cysteine methyltransferase
MVMNADAPVRERALVRPEHQATEATIEFALTPSWIGLVLVARRFGGASGVCAVLLGDDEATLTNELRRRFPDAPLVNGDASVAAVAARIARLIEAPARRMELLMDLPLDMRGTEFQRRVWHALQAIPAGSTESYTAIARRLGLPNGARAVAQACAANPLAVVVPCHRVVRSDGQLSGYRWGVARKRALLDREASA